MGSRDPSGYKMDLPMRESHSTASLPESRIICRVCQKQFSQYTCPRCNCRYCSLECYKKHSNRCTESFMRENVMEELQQVQAEEETKRKMLDILKRFHEEEKEEEEACDDSMLSEETIQKVLSGKEVKLEDLSLQEIKQFREAVASGKLSRMIEPWTPWWTKSTAKIIHLRPDGTQLVRPLYEKEEDTGEDSCNDIPAGPESPLPSLSQLTRTNPSPHLVVHVVDIIYSYCFTLRVYNGDWQCDSIGAAVMVLNISTVLGDDGRPETVLEALGGCFERSCSPTYKDVGGYEFAMGLVDDVITLLSLGSEALICLLSDLQRMLQAGERMLSSEKMDKTKTRNMNQKLRSAERKVYFLMCWVHEQPTEAWRSLANLVDVAKASLQELGSSSKTLKPQAKNVPKRKVVIEEVTGHS